MVAAQTRIGSQEAWRQAGITRATTSSGGKHGKIIPDTLVPGLLTLQSAFTTLSHWSITTALPGKLRRQRPMVNGKDVSK